MLERDGFKVAALVDSDPAKVGEDVGGVRVRHVDDLPEIVAHLPKPDELRAVTIGGNDGTTLAGLVAELGAVLGALRSIASGSPDGSGAR